MSRISKGTWGNSKISETEQNSSIMSLKYFNIMRITQFLYKRNSCAIKEIDSLKEKFFKSFKGNNEIDG